MATYKVAQDVEADDKLIGPFSFRQFVYLIVVAIAGVTAWGLWGILPPLAIIPLPVMIFFGALALPLRKDQPMETYLAAVVSFYLKPKKRLWQPDGVESLVEITAPKVIEQALTKDIAEDEATRRLEYLAELADTRGWSIRHANAPVGSPAISSEVYAEAQAAEDPLDEHGGVTQSFSAMIDQADQARHQQMLQRMQAATVSTTGTQPSYSDPYASLSQAQPQDDTTKVTFNPYPTNMYQSVISPLSDAPSPATQTKPEPQDSPEPPSPEVVSPDIINLANNSDFSIETIAHEAKRIQKKQRDEQEVVISLR